MVLENLCSPRPHANKKRLLLASGKPPIAIKRIDTDGKKCWGVGIEE
jgi:hypothetical protein